MDYRPFLTMCDEEVKFIINDILAPDTINSIERDQTVNEIKVGITSTWVTNDDNGKEVEVKCEDEIVLTQDDIEIPFSSSDDEHYKYQQFLLAKGYHPLLKDNSYL